MKNFLALLFLSAFLSSCVKDKPVTSIQPGVQLSAAGKVYTVNEGVFPDGNASVSLYDPGTGQVIENIYAAQNNNALVGDVAQNLALINSNYYLVVNNSGKILVCDHQFKKLTQVNNLSSPRYLLQITNQKAYVSDYTANAISIVDLNSNLKTGTIHCGGWTEKMVLIYNNAFVTNMFRNYLYVVNTITDALSDSVYLGQGAGNIVLDRQDKLWVLGTGDQTNHIAARLWRIDPLTRQILITITFISADSPGNLCLNRTKDTLFFLNKGIYRMAITDNILPAAPFVEGGTKNFYGLGVNPNDYTIYAADALDYDQRANVYIYDAKGNQKTVFKAGINTNGFYFE